MIEIAGIGLSARIDPLGAEVVSLRDRDGRELMTDADPAYWTGHAPILFPIVGALNGGVYRLEGREYALPQHGFARRSHFAVIEQTADAVTLRMADDDQTRAVYPFAFALDVRHSIANGSLTTLVTVHNRGDRDLPASIGFHPAFAWPLPYGRARDEHRIEFERAEGGKLARILPGAVIGEADRESPLAGRTLALSDDLFAVDALVWPSIESRWVLYGAPGAPRLRVDFPDTPMLGIWTKPGAAFVCVEPWHGIADPAGFVGDIWVKPGIRRLPPDARWSVEMRVTLAH